MLKFKFKVYTFLQVMLWFLDRENHLAKVCMSYFQHFYFSAKLGSKLLIGSYKAFVHALIPRCHTKSTSNLVEYLEKEMKTAGCKE
jgi:hypothetical protein